MGWWDDASDAATNAANSPYGQAAAVIANPYYAGQAGVAAAQGGNLGGPAGEVSDWFGGKTKAFGTSGWNIDPNAYVDQNAAANKANWGAAGTAAGGRGGPQINGAPQGQFRAGQQDLIAALTAASHGQGPSLADEQNKVATERNLSSAAALQGSARGMSPALQARQLQQTQADIGQNSANAAVTGRLQEQMNARGMLGDVLSGARGQDIGMATNQAQLNLQQGGMNDEMARFYAGLGAGTDAASFAAQQAEQALQVQNALGVAGINQQGQAASQSMFGGLAGAGSAAMGAILSDEEEKTGVSSGDSDVYGFLDAISPKDFSYKDPSAPGAAPGPQTGVMAQDLAKTGPGRQMVTPTPAGMGIDATKAIGPILAAAADLHKRVKALEGTAKAGAGNYARKMLDYIRAATKPDEDPFGGSQPMTAGVGG